ncbi:putative O-glycosylation ligase, exosortase A system-associated [Accumulibacter sp.]|uniref:putative O-glycosylation ligase, exosortase A system-associated n=1 Tax=Accumulibacter sp. TaxID=2053492 RepID=UPI0025F2878F|nr:putative O-glycosylation ligase, exosortase A system-associated [Accumulibacter sp.]MCM8595404.1 putative O-glycosylation ligase, exosortase A system-associated [Accumulibacter sp.]MCM8626415.1 putative O-glycosylation ligase, exosortase A system-associated [Accumulibacter sp.]MDS4049551.1 putative O-glycosylation ligase, exosortase A system-associated [Accumulibacter sp.]
MRDILITLIIVGTLPFILYRPSVGTYVWAWLGMMNPHKSAYGFATSLPFSQMVGIATLIAFPFSRERRPFPINTITVLYLLLLLWMTITSFFALNAWSIVLDRWLFVLKIHLMIFLTLMLLRGRQSIERLVWVIALSIGLYGVKGGLWTMFTGGGGRVWGPPGGFASENNTFGLSLVILLPLFYYLYQVATRRVIRLALIGCLVTLPFAILGTQSRGALLALISMATLLGLKGKRPVLTTILIATVVAAAVAFMPDSWSGRMQTIQSYEEDSSAMSRLYAWLTMWNLAVDRPIVGGGFVVDTPQVYALYSPGEVGSYKGGGTVLVAHSIYFQMLGEHGFPGLILYVLLGISSWRRAGTLAKEAERHPEYSSWAPMLMRMVQVSLVGFAAGGAFLSLAHFDLIYYIISLIVLVDASLREQRRAPA